MTNNGLRKGCHDKSAFYCREKEPLNDPEWFEAENTGVKHYYIVQMHNGGQTIKLFTPSLADLWSRRTGLAVTQLA